MSEVDQLLTLALEYFYQYQVIDSHYVNGLYHKIQGNKVQITSIVERILGKSDIRVDYERALELRNEARAAWDGRRSKNK